MNKKSIAQWFISDELWQKIDPLLPPHKTHPPLGCHRRRVDNRAAMNAIFFVLRTGCQWNALNATGICSSSRAHRRFQEWVAAGVFERLWQNGLLASEKIGAIDWSKLALDGCLTKAPLAGSKKQAATQQTGGKQGVKRSLLTDGQGLPLAIAVAPANIHDIRLVIATLDGLQTGGWGYGTQLHLDKAYEAEWLEKELKTRGYVPCVHSRKEEQDALAEQDDFKVNRWVVERTHSWLNRFRRILVRWEKRIENYEAMLHLACSLIAWNIILLG